MISLDFFLVLNPEKILRSRVFSLIALPIAHKKTFPPGGRKVLRRKKSRVGKVDAIPLKQGYIIVSLSHAASG